jgi:hypothetical protein
LKVVKSGIKKKSEKWGSGKVGMEKLVWKGGMEKVVWKEWSSQNKVLT